MLLIPAISQLNLYTIVHIPYLSYIDNKVGYIEDKMEASLEGRKTGNDLFIANPVNSSILGAFNHINIYPGTQDKYKKH